MGRENCTPDSEGRIEPLKPPRVNAHPTGVTGPEGETAAGTCLGGLLPNHPGSQLQLRDLVLSGPAACPMGMPLDFSSKAVVLCTSTTWQQSKETMAPCGDLESIPELEVSDDFTRGSATRGEDYLRTLHANKHAHLGGYAACVRHDCLCPASWNGRPGEHCCLTCRDGKPCDHPYHETTYEHHDVMAQPFHHTEGPHDPYRVALCTTAIRDDTIGYLSVNAAQASKGNADEQYFNVDTGATTYIVRDRRCITRPDLHRKQKIAVRTGSGTRFAESVGPATCYVLGEQDEVIEITRTMVGKRFFSTPLQLVNSVNPG